MFYLDDSVRVYESDDGGDIDLIVEEFKSFSREDWLSIPREALVLHCSNAHISCTGTKEALANRLHLHFHPKSRAGPAKRAPATEDSRNVGSLAKPN